MRIQELANTLSLELDDFGKELFVESNQHALSLKINLPVIPRVRHAVTDEEVQSFLHKRVQKRFSKSSKFIVMPLSITTAANVKFIPPSC